MNEISETTETVSPESADFSPNGTSADAAEYYRSVLAGLGVDPESLSFEEIVEVTRRFYPEFQASDFRRGRREAAKIEREARAAEARKVRESERKARLEKERVALEAKLAKLSGK